MDKHFDTRQLKAFCTVARTGGFTQAGKILHLTQSAVSHAVKALEQDLGCTLLHRLGKKVQLTYKGEIILQSAESILKCMENLRAEVNVLQDSGRERLRIGAGPTACQYILPLMMREFMECFPQCQIILESGETPASLEQLYANKTDLALTLAPRGIHECSFYPLFEDELHFIVAPGHSWAKRGRAVKAEISEQQYALCSRDSYTFRMISRFFKEEGIELNHHFELGSTAAIKELVKLSLCVGMLPSWVVRKEIKHGTMVSLPIGKQKIKRTWGISHIKGRELNHIEEKFVHLCELTCANL